MRKADLQKRVHELEIQLHEEKHKSKTVIEKQVYIPATTKLKTFSGRPVSKSDLSIDDWIDGLEIAFSARQYTDEQKVDLIYSHLEEQAKEEVKFYPGARHSPYAILDCLRSAFGNPESVTTLQQKFFARNQEDSETIRHYSYALLELYQIVIRKDASVFPNKYIALSEKFANGLRDPFLRKEAKRLLRNNPTEFHRFRDEIILFSEEEETTDKRTVIPPVNKPNTINDQPSLSSQTSDTSSADKLLKIIEAQQKQIDSLTTMVKDCRTVQQTKENSNSSRPPPVCYLCGKIGHVKKYCRSKPSEASGNK